MEGSLDKSRRNSAETSHGKRKERDEQLPQQSDTPDPLQTAAQVITWRSPEESPNGKGTAFQQGSISDKRTTVEELMLSNYKSSPPSICEESSSSKKPLFGADMPRGQLSIGGAESSPMHQSPTTNPVLSCSKVAEQLVRSDKHIVPMISMPDEHTGGIRTKILPVNGFPQFAVKSPLRVTEVVKANDAWKGNVEGTNNQNQQNAVKVAEGATTSVGGATQPLDSPNEEEDEEEEEEEEISLRLWLWQERPESDKAGRMHIFKQILRIVEESHSQGLVLQHLCPSYFMISPENQVRYFGSFISMGLPPDQHPPKRLRHECAKHGAACGEVNLDFDDEPTSSDEEMALNFLKLERMWYTSPEELYNIDFSFPSNIYSLGVIVFELFSSLETWELYVSMPGLAYRVLPLSFLSECSREAAFCLRLLHPVAFSRPNLRDILESDFISEIPDSSVEPIDEEDAEVELLDFMVKALVFIGMFRL